jgi:carbon storage regulator CsrA
MLCLTRKLHEGVIIIDDKTQEVIRFDIAKMSSGKVTIAIKAPEHYRILRTELMQAPSTT